MKIINPASLPSPSGYSNGVLSEPGKILCIAGQIGWDENAQIAKGLVSQFDRALRNVLGVVREAGGKPEHIVRITIYVTDKHDYIYNRRELGTIYRNVMGSHYPAMSLLIVKDLLEEYALVEIEATAVIP
jgi:enamine deaminase RidA (YjgF/YER057c/UK114 family)